MFQISKVAIRNYQVGRRIPHCGIELELLSEQVQRLRHKVDIKGISPLGDNFYLRYPQSDGERLNNNDQNNNNDQLHSTAESLGTTTQTPSLQTPAEPQTPVRGTSVCVLL